MVSTKSTHLFPDNSLKAFNGLLRSQSSFNGSTLVKTMIAPPSLPIRLRLIHIYPVTDTNRTSDQWFYLHKNIILLAIILILKHILFRQTQNYVSPVMNCLVCCMSLYSFGVICSSYCIRTRSHQIGIVVKFYNHTLRVGYGYIPMRYYASLVLFYNENGH